jgi:tetratricopeptide (TPR) repeat protein
VREVLDDQADAPHASLYLGMIEFRRGHVDAALAHLKAGERAEPRIPGLHVQIGNVCLRRRRWKDAERAFTKALAIDGDSAEPHDGLGVSYRWQKRPADAVHAHMQSIARLHYRPQPHIHLGLALAESGQIDWAIRAFHVALEQNPDSVFAAAAQVELMAGSRVCREVEGQIADRTKARTWHPGLRRGPTPGPALRQRTSTGQ